jgi:hypothetical protein
VPDQARFPFTRVFDDHFLVDVTALNSGAAKTRRGIRRGSPPSVLS